MLGEEVNSRALVWLSGVRAAVEDRVGGLFSSCLGAAYPSLRPSIIEPGKGPGLKVRPDSIP